MHPGHHPQQFMHPAPWAAMQLQQRQLGPPVIPIQPRRMPPNMMPVPTVMPSNEGPGGPMPSPPPYGVDELYGEDPNLDSGMKPYGGLRGEAGRGGRGDAGRGRGDAGRGDAGRGGREGGRGGRGRGGRGRRLGYHKQPPDHEVDLPVEDEAPAAPVEK